MEVISTAILSHKPSEAKSLIEQGFIITPQHVQALLVETSSSKSFEVATARVELADVAIELKTQERMSIQELLVNQRLSDNMNDLDIKFVKLLDAWDKELNP